MAAGCFRSWQVGTRSLKAHLLAATIDDNFLLSFVVKWLGFSHDTYHFHNLELYITRRGRSDYKNKEYQERLWLL